MPDHATHTVNSKNIDPGEGVHHFETASTDPGAAPTALLPMRLTDLRFTAGSTDIIGGIDLVVPRGGCTAVMGFNGAGKSVLLRLMHGLLTPTGGRVEWANPLTDRDARRRQAMVFQQPVLLRRSVADNIEYALKRHLRRRIERRRKLEELLALGDLEHLANRPARALSGGERQRVAMVRALGVDPEILFLDEPTASLDPGSTGTIERLVLTAVERGSTAVLVTHNRGQAKRLAHRVVFIHRGRIAEDNPVERFFDRPDSAPARAFTEGRLPD